MPTMLCYWPNHYYQFETMYEYKLNFDKLSLTIHDLFMEIGYGCMEPEDSVRSLAASMLDDVASWAAPSCTFSLFNGQVEKDMVLLADGECFHVGTTIANLLKGSTSFAFFVATAGRDFQEFQNQLKLEGDMLKCFIADVLGTCIVEKTGDCLEQLLEDILGKERHTSRLSPGYCGWALSDQKSLFRILGDSPCGVHLSDVCLMEPIKSISGLMGIGTNVVEKEYGCRYCQQQTCYRRKNKSRHL